MQETVLGLCTGGHLRCQVDSFSGPSRAEGFFPDYVSPASLNYDEPVHCLAARKEFCLLRTGPLVGGDMMLYCCLSARTEALRSSALLSLEETELQVSDTCTGGRITLLKQLMYLQKYFKIKVVRSTNQSLLLFLVKEKRVLRLKMKFFVYKCWAIEMLF